MIVPNNSCIERILIDESILIDDDTQEIMRDNIWNTSHNNDNCSTVDVEDLSPQSQGDSDKLIGRKETQAVTRLKLIVIFILVASSILIGVTTYCFMRFSEQSKFNEYFQEDGDKVMQSIGASVENTFAAMDLFSTMMISHAISTNQSWPFVTIPHYGNKVSKTFSMSVGMSMSSMMIVESDQRKEWEDYAWANRGMVNESLEILSTDVNFRGPIAWDVPLLQSIHSVDGPIPLNES
jgi:hypothetical protein